MARTACLRGWPNNLGSFAPWPSVTASQSTIQIEAVCFPMKDTCRKKQTAF